MAEEKKGFLSGLREKLSRTRERLAGRIESLIAAHRSVSPELLDELEEILIGADIGVKTTAALMEKVRAKVKGPGSCDPADVREQIREELIAILTQAAVPLEFPQVRPFVILMVGVNGTGKTTTIGKLAHLFAGQGKMVVLAAADTFRAAGIEQLEVWGVRAGAEVVKQRAGADPAAVIFDAARRAVHTGADVLIADTAGRLHTKVNLMEELKKVRRVVAREIPGAPHETLLVIDATTGQNALEQARLFHDAVELTGIALAKLDGTAKGGIIIAVAQEVGVPVKFIGVGEKIEDLRPFDAKEFVEAIL